MTKNNWTCKSTHPHVGKTYFTLMLKMSEVKEVFYHYILYNIDVGRKTHNKITVKTKGEMLHFCIDKYSSNFICLWDIVKNVDLYPVMLVWVLKFQNSNKFPCYAEQQGIYIKNTKVNQKVHGNCN